MTPRPDGLVLANARVATADGVQRRDLAIAGGVVVEPGGLSRPRRVDLSGHLVFPGLVNAHDHLALDHFPEARLPVAANSYEWIEAFQPLFAEPAFAAVAALPARVRAAAGALKNVLAGATVVQHHDPWEPAFDEAGFPVEVVRRYGWCHSLELAGRYGPTVEASRADTPAGAPWLIHLAEGTDDVAASELSRLEALGLLDERTVLVHGVGLTARDEERVLAKAASVVWCPSSNLRLLGKTLDPRRLAAAGRLALGTDSRLSGSFDLLHELRAARDASGLSARDLLRLVTVDAARVLRLGRDGTLAAGQPADLVVLRDSGGDPHEQLLNARRASLSAVLRAGRACVADPELWNELAEADGARVLLDGAPKVISPDLARVPEALALEPGLELARD